MTATTEAPADAGKKGKKGKGDKEKGGKSNLVPALVLAAGLAAGGYFMSGPSTVNCTGKDCPVTPTTQTTVAPGLIATMDPLSVNLADGHFLKVGLAVELAEGIDNAEFAKGDIMKLKDMLIARLGGAKMEDLSTVEGRKQVKEDLLKQCKKVYDGTVLDLYFTDFVMQ